MARRKYHLLARVETGRKKRLACQPCLDENLVCVAVPKKDLQGKDYTSCEVCEDKYPGTNCGGPQPQSSEKAKPNAPKPKKSEAGVQKKRRGRPPKRKAATDSSGQ